MLVPVPSLGFHSSSRSFDGGKDAFCKAFVEGDGERKIYQARAAEIDRLNGMTVLVDLIGVDNMDNHDFFNRKAEFGSD